MQQAPEQPAAFHPTTLEEAVIATLRFFALFRHPLTLEELSTNLLKIHPATPSLRAESDPERREGEDEARQSPSIADMEEMCQKSESIISSNGLYTLPGHEADFDYRTRMAPTLRKRLSRVRHYTPFLRHIPFVRGVFLCNNLSFGIATERGDIDLLIATSPGHIFTSRFLCTALFHILGIRRHGSKTTDRFCLSFYVTEDNLDFSTFKLQPQDIYLAYWTKHLIPCFPSQISRRIEEKNKKWVQQELGMVQLSDGKPPLSHRGPSLLQRFLEIAFRAALGRWIESRLATYQKHKLTRSSSSLADTSGTVISDTMLKFHDRDRRREYQKRWENNCYTTSGEKL